VINTAPQNGTIICNVLNTLPLNQVLGMVKTNLDVSELQWIGNPSREVYIMVVNSTAPSTSYKEMLEKQVILGASTNGSLSWMYPQIMNTILGTKFKIVGGYGGFAAIDLAMARREVDGDVGAPWYDINSANGYSPKIREGALKVVVQVGHQKAQQLPNVPLLNELANSGDDRTLLDLFTSPTEFGKPTVMSPHVPADRVALMRKAYMDTMKDPAFIADATEQGLTVDPIEGEELQGYAKKIVGTPKALVERAKNAVAD
jgi:tripartite-type tricarboxylate transporter receptor subunit TctC